MRLIVALIASICIQVGCLRPLRLPERDLIAPARLVGIIEAQKSGRQRVSGSFQAKATGIKQFFGSLDLTLAAQLPASFYLSIPSFFGNPARVVTSDNKHLYVLDLSGGETLFLKEPTDSASLERWIGFSITAGDFVNALLGVIDLEGGVIVDAELSRNRARYSIKIRYNEGRYCIAEFSESTDDLLSKSMFKNDQLIYRVDYSDFRPIKGGNFPWQTKIAINGPKESVELRLFGSDLNFDEEPIDITTFQLEEP